MEWIFDRHAWTIVRFPAIRALDTTFSFEPLQHEGVFLNLDQLFLDFPFIGPIFFPQRQSVHRPPGGNSPLVAAKW